MRVSDSHRVLFVHVPKTGGSTIDAIFDREVADSRQVARRPRHSPLARLVQAEPALDDYWTCGFVRNPWARMVSWWAMVSAVFDNADAGHEQALRKIQNYPKAWLPEGRYRHDFDRFVLEGTEEVPKIGRPQIRTLNSAKRTADFVGRVENFTHDVNVVRDRLGLQPLQEVPRRNKSTHGHYHDYYNDTTRAKVAEVFKDDIEAFDYTY